MVREISPRETPGEKSFHMDRERTICVNSL